MQIESLRKPRHNKLNGKIYRVAREIWILKRVDEVTSIFYSTINVLRFAFFKL